jgi:hypothetical protein
LGRLGGLLDLSDRLLLLLLLRLLLLLLLLLEGEHLDLL